MQFEGNKIIVHPDFFKLIDDLKKSEINIQEESFSPTPYYVAELTSEGNIEFVEKRASVSLDPNLGYENIVKGDRLLCGYDESLISLPALEGTGYFFAHALVVLNESSYIPVVKLTFNFFTKSKALIDKSKKIKPIIESLAIDSKKEYIAERRDLLENFAPQKSILLIDGPLLGEQISSENVKLNYNLLEKDIIPIFIVKNSNSSLVIDSISELKGKFNSDFEWAFKTLKNGQRTTLAYYEDEYNTTNNKFFAYVKSFGSYVTRIEFHKSTWDKYKDFIINNAFNIIYYEILSQGSENAQPKIIAIAENYARETLNMLNVKNILEEVGITPTMNYKRFGWS